MTNTAIKLPIAMNDFLMKYEEFKTRVIINSEEWDLFCFLTSTIRQHEGEKYLSIRFCEANGLVNSGLNGLNRPLHEVIWEEFPENPEMQNSSTESKSFYQDVWCYSHDLYRDVLNYGTIHSSI